MNRATPDLSARRPKIAPMAWALLGAIVLVNCAIAISMTALNIAIPEINAAFGASPRETNWLLVAYQLTNVGLILLAGQIADNVDRRLMFSVALVVFTIASAGLALSPNIETMIALRTLQGLASAALLCNTAVLLSAVFPAARLSTAMAIYIASFSIAQVAGPLVGGVITDNFGWRWNFASTVPISVAALVAGLIVLRRVSLHPIKATKIDIGGNLLAALGVGVLLIAAANAAETGWDSPWVLGLLAVFIAIIPVMVRTERRATNPALDASVWRDRTLFIALVSSFFLTAPRLGLMVSVGIYFQGLEGDSPTKAALSVTFIAIGLTIGSLGAPTLGRLIREEYVGALGGLLTLVALVVLIWALPDHRLIVDACLMLAGAGTGLFQTVNASAILRRAPEGKSGSVNSVRILINSLSLALSSAVAVSLLVTFVDQETARSFLSGAAQVLTGSQTADLVLGMQCVAGVLAALVVIGIALEATQMRRARLSQTS